MARTKFFSRFDPTEEGQAKFRSGLLSLLKVPDRSRGALFTALANLDRAPTRRLENPVYRNLSNNAGLAESEIRRAVQAAQTFATVFQDDEFSGDSPQALVDDLVDSHVIASSEAGKLAELVTSIAKLAPELERDRRRRSEAQAGLPYMTGLHIRVNYRPVFVRDYEVYSPADDYHPECIGVVPVITAHLVLHDSPVEEITFSMTPEHASAVLEHVRAVLKQLDNSNEFLGLKASNDSKSEVQ